MRSIRAIGLTGLRFTAPCGSSSAVAVARQQALRALSTSTPKAQLKTAVPSQSVSFDQELRRLNEQRSVRPVSPHLSIYQPQLTWYGSIANRITGAGLSGALYAFAVAYAVAPFVGLAGTLSSASLAGFVAGLPFAVKLALKVPLAAAASYHTWNGFRHLAWDSGRALSLKKVYSTGYVVIGLTVASTIGLCLL